MTVQYTFPFGQPVQQVIQQDRTPKRVFVLGVYASAVHAKWVGPDGKTKIMALAVASEPYIFWRGDNAEEIIANISIPPDLGKLAPAAADLNGPSGTALDDLFLSPLGITRDDAWLCDLVPHSCLNQKQKKAIRREYLPLTEEYDLPEVTLPPVPRELTDEVRREAILSEIQEAKPEIIVLLGDLPIRWWLRFYDDSWNALSYFGTSSESYGKLHECNISGRKYQVLPLAHPRQAGRLGAHSGDWAELHESWAATLSRHTLTQRR
jgi:uracil-DNA glycosylase